MSFTLYNYVLSGNCYKIRLFASLLGVSHQTIAIDFHPGQKHKSEDILKLNPAGTLPILVTNDTVFTETPAMLVWLATQHDSTNTWWPINDSHQIAIIVQWLAFSSRLSATVGELRLHTMLNKPVDANAKQVGSISALRELENHLTEQHIKGYPWITGINPTIADIACFAYAALSPDAGIEHDDYPCIRRWLHAVRSLDGFLTMPGIHELHERRDVDTGDSGAGKPFGEKQ